jgi:ATP-binding cassette subfamily C exporter for protease/lipase
MKEQTQMDASQDVEAQGSRTGLQRSAIARILYSFRHEFAWVGFFSAVSNILMIVPTLYMLQVYDRVMISQNEFTLIAISTIAVMLYVFLSLAEWLRSKLLVRLSMMLDESLSTRVFRSGFMAYLRSRTLNPTECLNDLVVIRQFLTGNGAIAFFDLPWVPVYLFVSFMLHVQLGVAAVFFAVIQIALTLWVHRSSTGKMQEVSQANTKANQFLMAKLKSAELIEALGMKATLTRRWLDRYLAYLDLHRSSNMSTQRQMLIIKFFQFSQQSLILGLGALLVIDGEISPGAMVAANLLLAKTLQPLQMLVSSWRGYVQFMESYGRLNELFTQYPQDSFEALEVPKQGGLVLNAVELKVPGRAQPVVHALSLDLPAGQVVAIVGHSGAGKSSLARMIMGVGPDHEGEILVGGVPIANCDRSVIGYMPQDIELLEGTIAENIARYATDAPEKIVAAAQLAHAHEMILRLPKGYDTPVGEAGQLLSGGQRQRLALARALYDEPLLVVLDEPNAHLDDAGEKALLQAMAGIRQARKTTALLISHRPSLLQACDRVLIMAEGRMMRDMPAQDLLRSIQARAAANAAAPTGTPSADTP